MRSMPGRQPPQQGHPGLSASRAANLGFYRPHHSPMTQYSMRGLFRMKKQMLSNCLTSVGELSCFSIDMSNGYSMLHADVVPVFC